MAGSTRPDAVRSAEIEIATRWSSDRSTVRCGVEVAVHVLGTETVKPTEGLRTVRQPGGGVAMGRAGDEIFLLSRVSAGAPVEMHSGRYVRESHTVRGNG